MQMWNYYQYFNVKVKINVRLLNYCCIFNNISML